MPTLTPAQWVSPEELAAHLSVSPRTVRKLIRDGGLPADCYMKVGTAIRLHKDRTMARLIGA